MLRASLGQCGQFTVAFRVHPKIIIRRKWLLGLSLDQSQDKMPVPMIFVGEHLARNGVRNPYPLMVVHSQSLHSGNLPLLQVLARTFSPAFWEKSFQREHGVLTAKQAKIKSGGERARSPNASRLS